MLTCLSSHHISVRGTPEFFTCLQASQTIADVTTRLTKAAR
jgi:hypothetical protein